MKNRKFSIKDIKASNTNVELKKEALNQIKGGTAAGTDSIIVLIQP